jgi:hypothetical protein
MTPHGACPCIYGHLKRAIELLDDSRDLSRRAHILLDLSSTRGEVCEASAALLDAGRMRVEAMTEVRQAWSAMQRTEVLI